MVKTMNNKKKESTSVLSDVDSFRVGVDGFEPPTICL